jgi:BMFP domain-containing protein YqiC
MQTDNRLLDDLARVAGGAMGALSGVRTEVEELVRQRLERLLSDMDLVPREEFEAVQAMAEKARLEQEKLEKRVAALEVALTKKKAAKPRRAKSASASKTASKTSGKTA